MAASLRWVLQLHKEVPKAAKLYSEGLGFTVNVCTPRWAELELQPGPLRLALMESPTAAAKSINSENVVQKEYSSLLSFTVQDINSTVTKLMALGAELDGPIKHDIHGKGGSPRRLSKIILELRQVAAMRCLDGHIIGLYEPI